LDKINLSFNQALQSQEVKGLLLTQGMDAIGGSKEEMAKYISQETDKWSKLIKSAGVTMD
jgi:tripartite-type tricarboxylate transporter receptor subunit TctC